MISKHDLMLRGARSRLVELNKERLELLKMFKELDIQEEKPVLNNHLPEPPKGASGRRLVKGGTIHKLWAYMSNHPVIITPDDITEPLKLSRTGATSALNQLVGQKLAVRVGRGRFRLK